MKLVPTKKALLDEFIAKYSKEFEITGGQLMTRFLGLWVEQDNHCISLYLDQYITKTIEEYQKFTSKQCSQAISWNLGTHHSSRTQTGNQSIN
jgi:hypothetical protein